MMESPIKSERLLRPCEVYTDHTKGRRGKLPISRATYYQWIKEGKLPKAKRLSERISVHPEAEIDAAIALLAR